eukprot:gene5108-10221_t
MDRSNILSVAPMIQWTDRYWRYLMRQITRETMLYSEMVMDQALLNNPSRLEDFIGYSRTIEPPLTVQLGGCTEDELGDAAALCEQFGGFSEINLNTGCPSNKAKRGGFGAELMLNPELVRRIVYNMKRKVTHTQITVKCRLGVTGRESWENLVEYVAAVKAGGVNKMIIHARNCVLRGLSPAQNRNVPPLRYDVVYDLVRSFPDMTFILNGGITTFEEAEKHLGIQEQTHDESASVNRIDEDSTASTSRPEGRLETTKTSTSTTTHVHGVMIGRAAYNNPWMFADADRRFFQKRNPTYTRREAAHTYLDHVMDLQSADCFGSRIPTLAKPLHNFFSGCTENKLYKHKLDDLIKESTTTRKDLTIDDIFWEAVEGIIPDSILDTRPGI